MKNINYIVSVILVILWVVGFFTHTGGNAVHLLLGGALILILINIIQEDKSNTTENI